jgi:hypothetical protein
MMAAFKRSDVSETIFPVFLESQPYILHGGNWPLVHLMLEQALQIDHWQRLESALGIVSSRLECSRNCLIGLPC